MKDLKGIKGDFYVASLIEEGEHENQDFKFAITDSRKIARSISAFANHSGGRLLVGVKDNGIVAGVRNEEDIYMVEQAAQVFCIPPQSLKVDAFKVQGGKLVLRVEIARCATPPVMVKEAGGQLKAYFRIADENIAAHPLMVRAWQQASSGTAGAFMLDDLGRTVLELASSPEGIDPEQIMLAAHVSRAWAEDTIVNLVAMNLLEFKYSGGVFKLSCRESV